VDLACRTMLMEMKLLAGSGGLPGPLLSGELVLWGVAGALWALRVVLSRARGVVQAAGNLLVELAVQVERVRIQWVEYRVTGASSSISSAAPERREH
jgi:hypothetical protein